MRDHRRSEAFLAAVLLCFRGSAAWAQDRPVNLYLTSPLSLESGFESGVPDGNVRLNEPATILTLPTFSLMRTSPRNDFTIYYQPQFEMFTSLHRLDSVNQNAGLSWLANMTPRWSLSVNDVVTNTRDEGATFESTFLLPRGPYTDNGFYTSVNFDATPNTQIKFRYENAFVSYDAVNLSTPLFFSRMGSTEGLTLEHHFTPRLKVSGGYDYLRVTSFDKYDPAGNLIGPFAATQFATGTLTFDATRSLLMEVTGGYVHNPLNSYLVGGLIEKHLQHMTIAAGYNRYLTFAGAPTAESIDEAVPITAARLLPPNSISNTASLRVKGDLSEHWSIETTIMVSQTSGTTNFTALRSAMGGMRLSYRISDHVAFFASTDLYRQNANVILPVPISRSRFFGGISYTFSPTPDEIVRRREAARNGLRPQSPTQ
jgi:hypothetical protein